MMTNGQRITNSNARKCDGCGDMAVLHTVFFVDADNVIRSENICYECIMANTSDDDPLFSEYASAVRSISGVES